MKTCHDAEHVRLGANVGCRECREFFCSHCRKWLPLSPEGSYTTGYGYTSDRKRKVCFACCAVLDVASMRDTGACTLYLDESAATSPTLCNWPGTLRINVKRVRKGKHNIARTRTDVWFTFDGQAWHGVQYGEFTQLTSCKRVTS